MVMVREYLARYQVPQRLVELMMTRSSAEVHWLTDEDLMELRIFSPGAEELLISKCGYDPSDWHRMDQATARHDQRAGSAIQARINEVVGCYWSGPYSEFATKRLAGLLLKMQKGWRPWQANGAIKPTK